VRCPTAPPSALPPPPPALFAQPSPPSPPPGSRSSAPPPKRRRWRHWELEGEPPEAASSTEAHLAAGWGPRIAADWRHSLEALSAAWAAHGGFDALLGFSNGAAAAALLAAHVAADPSRFPGGLRCVVLAGGYLPQPLEQLLPPGGGQAPLVSTPSLHFAGRRDAAVPPEASRQLAEALFAPAGRTLELHDGGHAVPQRQEHCALIHDFLSRHTGGGGAASGSNGRPHASPAAPAPPPAAAPEPPPAAEATPEQAEELEALEAIFGGEYRLLTAAPPACAVRLPAAADGDGGSGRPPASAHFELRVRMSPGYPAQAPPAIDVVGPLAAADPRRGALLAHLAAVAADNAGAGCVYQLVEAAREWTDGNLPPDIAERRLDGRVAAAAAPAAAGAVEPKGPPWWAREEADASLIRAAMEEAEAAYSFDRDAGGGAGGDPAAAAAAAPGGDGEVSEAASASARGLWAPFTIGLVGKPSAGKSSFFNAACDPARDEDGAKVGAFPFTTINPNVGRAFIAAPDPAAALGLEPGACHPAHGSLPAFEPAAAADPRFSNAAPLHAWAASFGWAPLRWRRVPVVLKDVAGLIPGAYKGLGRGNQFLNDICDADVIIHVVDVSGSTTRAGAVAGEEGAGSDPLDEIEWVREELHR
jgi:predicted esterase